jgi:hypothetical protein
VLTVVRIPGSPGSPVRGICAFLYFTGMYRLVPSRGVLRTSDGFHPRFAMPAFRAGTVSYGIRANSDPNTHGPTPWTGRGRGPGEPRPGRATLLKVMPSSSG